MLLETGYDLGENAPDFTLTSGDTFRAVKEKDFLS